MNTHPMDTFTLVYHLPAAGDPAMLAMQDKLDRALGRQIPPPEVGWLEAIYDRVAWILGGGWWTSLDVAAPTQDIEMCL